LGSLLTAWQLEPRWLAVVFFLGGTYSLLRMLGQQASTVRAWRVVSFLLGCALLWVCVASGVAGYAMAVFWMHMVLHLLLIMVVPVLLVLGHPLSVAVEAVPATRQARVRDLVASRPVGLLTHPLAGLVVYTVVIIGTHLTGFMDQMAIHPWLMTGEQALYVVAGFLFFLPLIGEEPTGSGAPYLLRLVILLIAMVPDTLVGIVLLQTDRDPYPLMRRHHPAWAPSAMTDIHTAGGLMWAGGDGLMMLAAVGLVISVVISPTRRDRMTGDWLEGVRLNVVTVEMGSDPATPIDPDSDEALAAYNRMLRRRATSARDR